MSDLLASLQHTNLDMVQQAFVGGCKNCNFPIVLPVLTDRRKVDDVWPFHFMCPICGGLSTCTKKDTTEETGTTGTIGTIYKLRLYPLNPREPNEIAKTVQELTRLKPKLDTRSLWQLEIGLELGPVHIVAPMGWTEREFITVAAKASGKYLDKIDSIDRCFQYDFQEPNLRLFQKIG